jgi:DNA-directed RNA polymerase specialized sigma24 family protein
MARPYDHTSLGGDARAFPPTEWTKVLSCPHREAVLAELCQKYWKPVYCYLRGMGFGNEQAKDLTQGFFTEKVLGQDLAAKADREKGRFRSFLLRAVHNYAVSAQRAGRTHLSLDDDHEVGDNPSNPESEFNRAWADGLLQEVLEELELECQERKKLAHWQVFHDWLLEPQIEQKKEAMDQICARYGVPDASAAYHMIENVKRRFRAILRDRLGTLAGSEEEIELEIRDFIDTFSSGPTRM